MNPTLKIFASLAILATSHALPIGNGFAGIALAPGPLNTFYSQEVTVGDHPVNVGFGWTKDGTLSGGIRFESKFRGRSLPVSLSFAGNVKDLKRTFQFELGTRLLDKVSGVIFGDKNGLKWQTSLWVPIERQGSLRALGVSLEGDRTRPVAVSGGIGVNDALYQARVTLDKDFKPTGTNILASSSQQENKYYNKI